ncbi:T9SS type A sorting domain-containing protein [Mesonia sp. K7]|uniref:T9SS type A sorting domain-containing protein n=1 Tax=Mesonia sp. K7 TaxID=2218606 RepID=UPI000DA73E6D|nr:T9SS type A sorting domain-containing protein [Mesonia sp. K7]PZD79485.1 hypothetical protein DNG35_00295 [Mesonia sp. K7]
MKTKLFFINAFIFCFFAKAQETTVNVSMAADSTDEVYYKISTDITQNFTAADWDLAFLRTSAMNMAIRVNDGVGIKVFEASADINDWATIDISNEANWTELYNDCKDWNIGAFDTGTATYGWGEYNPANHHVSGTIIFVLKYSDGTYRKLFIDDYYGGYTFKYATWDATNSVWTADETHTVANASNPNQIFNYYSLATDSEVIAEPASTDWDFVFRKYTADYPYNGTTIKYTLTGVLQHPELVVAENIEPNGQGDTSNLTYESEIDIIGYDWKSFSGTAYSVNPDLFYYVKYPNGSIYRVHFTDYSGNTNGNIIFTTEDVTSQLNITSFENGNSFGFYPNPAQGEINLVYETAQANDIKVNIYNQLGQSVIEKQLKNNGFYNQALDISQLNTGTYLIQFVSGKQQTTKKLIIQ